MSILGYFLYVLLAATATTASRSPSMVDQLKNARKLLKSTIDITTDRVNDTTIAAQEYFNAVYYQILLLQPLNTTYLDGEEEVKFSQAPSTECYEFLNNRIETNKPLVVKCLETYESLMMDHGNRAFGSLNRVMLRLDERRRFAHYCVIWNHDNLSEALMCIRAVLRDITEVSYRATQQTWKMVDAVEKVANTWIPKTGACVAGFEGANAMEEWSKACEKQ